MKGQNQVVSRRTVVIANLVPTACGAFGAAVHAWAGYSDEGRAVLQPVGHGSLFAAFAWVMAGLVSCTAIAAVGRRALLAFVTGVVALTGLILLISV